MVAALLVEGAERSVEAAGVEMPLERLEVEICELAGHLAAGECRWLLLLSEFDRREGWTGWGLQSCAHWLSHRCGIGLQAAREKLRVGRRLEELPLVRGAFAAGELSYSKVRAVCRVARPETEATLLEMARYATTTQLEEIVRAYRSVTGREEMRHANDRHDARFARWHWDDDGSLVLTARLSPEDGAVVLAALDAGRAVADPPAPGGSAGAGDSAESLLAEARSADALVAMAKLALAAPAEGASPAPEIVIVDRPTLSGATDKGRCHLDGGVAIPPETARRLACDSTVAALVEATDGTPLDVGRKRRTPPAPLRRALHRRDGGCRFPGCGQRRFLHAHHIVHWINGGATKLINLILLCSRHHRLVHEGGYGIETSSDHVFVFLDPAGRVLPETPPAVPAVGPGIARRNEFLGLTITPDSCRSLGGGEPYDLGLAVEALLTPHLGGELNTTGEVVQPA
jgi:hypothetical protein